MASVIELSAARSARRTSSARVADVQRIAAELFAQNGYEGLNLENVAREAHVSRSWLYARFPDRRALLASLVELEADALVRRMASSLPLTSNLHELIRTALTLFVDYVSERREEYLMLFGPAASLEPDVGTTLLELRERLARAYVALFQPAVQALGVRWPSDDEARLVAHAMIALTEGAVQAWLSDPRITRDYLVDTTADMLQRGLLGHSA